MAECGGLQLTPPKAQRVNERRVLEIKAKEGIEDSLVDADFRTLCKTACSKASYDKQHRDEGLESRQAAELREREKEQSPTCLPQLQQKEVELGRTH